MGTSDRPRFFHDYNRAIGTAYAGLLAGLAGYFAFQLHHERDGELAFIQGQVERHAQFIEFVLRSSTDQIEGLRLSIAADLASARACEAGRAQATGEELRTAAAGFNRDTAAERDSGGNLVGEGVLAGRDVAFYCDLGAALGLNNQLAAMTFHLPNAAHARFVSTQGFYLQAPWQPAATLPPPATLRAGEAWSLGQPAANPDRLKYWVPPYFAGEETGLLAPVAAPAYDGERFAGVVAIDMSLDYLNRINSGFAYPLGMVSLVDADGRVLAHPTLYRDPLAVRSPPRFEQFIPREVLGSHAALVGLPPGEATALEGWHIIRRPLVAAPWQVVYAVPAVDLWEKLLRDRAPGMTAVLAALMLLMGVTYAVTLRAFVGPAAKLVSHVEAQGSGGAVTTPRVPPAWVPWFEAISRAFRESVQLGSLRKEVDIAARMQQSILPRHWPQDPRFTLRGTMKPARDIGGDFYDHFPLADDALGLVVADVSGKGISAGLFAMVCKTLLRSLATQSALTPGALAALVNDAMCADNDTSMFVTAFYGRYEPARGLLRFVNAGHPPPLLLRADGRTLWLPPTGGTAFGVMEGMVYREEEVSLAPGDTLFVFTDGVTEAIDAAGEEFGRQRLADLFAAGSAASPEVDIKRVFSAVEGFAAGVEQFDDITCVALRRGGAGEGT